MMKQYNWIPLGLTILTSLFLGACSQDEEVNGLNGHQESDLIIFDAKGDNVGTRAADQGEITFLPEDTRFALRMYYNDQTDKNATDLTKTMDAYMRVSSDPETVRCIYTKEYGNGELDDKNDEKGATKLYWENRKNHGFLGFFLNNTKDENANQNYEKGNSLIEKPEITGNSITIPMERYYTTTSASDGESTEVKHYLKQYDPMMAVKIQQPTSSNTLANRVFLIFEHQTACVEVNIKADKVSVEPTTQAGDIGGEEAWVDKISLLGTAKEITVYTKMDKDGNIVDDKNNIIKRTIAEGKDPVVCWSLPSEEKIKELLLTEMYSIYDNSLSADDKAAKIKPNYNVTARGLAFGMLEGLGITWTEHRNDEAGNQHAITYEFKKGDQKDPQVLESGKKYIYNVTLRRGTIATITLDIVDWEDDGYTGKAHDAEGVIDKTTTTTP